MHLNATASSSATFIEDNRSIMTNKVPMGAGGSNMRTHQHYTD